MNSENKKCLEAKGYEIRAGAKFLLKVDGKTVAQGKGISLSIKPCKCKKCKCNKEEKK